MTAWTSDEITRIGTATELQIASARRDGTLRKPRTIWVVRVGDDLLNDQSTPPTATSTAATAQASSAAS